MNVRFALEDQSKQQEKNKEKFERCIQASSLSHICDINATQLMIVNRNMFNLITERIPVEIERATVSQKHDVLRERQRIHWDENPYDDTYRY